MTDDNEIDNDSLAWAKDLPWYRRPNEKWLRPAILLLALGSGMVIGPKIELGTQLVCEEILGIEEVTPSSRQPHALSHALSWLPAPRERPPLSDACLASPEVEAGYTALGLRITLAMGITSVITTGFWGGLSDRVGRTFVLRLVILGFTLSDVFYIVLGLFPAQNVPLGKELLVFSAVIEGLLGGLATTIAAHLAYVSDVTPNGTRASVFSFITGLLFFGFSLGPALGGVVVKSLGSTMAPFYFALASHLSYLIFATLFLPESRNPERMAKAQEEYRQAKSAFTQNSTRNHGFVLSRFRLLLSYLAEPFRPLLLLAPQRRQQHEPEDNRDGEAEVVAGLAATTTASTEAAIETAQPSSSTVDLHGHRAIGEASASHISVSHTSGSALDWNLTLAAIAYLVEACCYGVVTPKISYAMLKYQWKEVEIGYYLSYVGMARVACLLVIIPLFVKWTHKSIRHIALSHDGKSRQASDETHALLDEQGRPFADHTDADEEVRTTNYGSTSESAEPFDHEGIEDDDDKLIEGLAAEGSAEHVEQLWAMRALHLRQIHDSRFDRRLAIGSLLITALAYLLLGVTANVRGSQFFIALSGAASLGGGASAALSSLGLALLNGDGDSGKFFAAWSIASALGQTILGPILFTSLFVRTASFAPQGIFFLSFALFVLASLVLAMVRVRHPRSLPPLPPRPHTSATLRRQRASTQTAKKAGTGSSQDSGFLKSTSSRIRLRAKNPFAHSGTSAPASADQ